MAERRRSGEGAQRRATFMEALVESSTDAITVVDAEGRSVYSSPAAARLFRWDDGFLEGGSAFEVVHPDDLDEVVSAFREVTATPGAVARREFRIRTGDGSWRTVEALATNRLDDPRVSGIVINTRDVTDRTQTEVALQESEERYRRLVEHSPQAIAVQQRGTFVYVNRATVRLLGATDESELVGRPVRDFIHPDEVPTPDDDVQPVDEGAEISVRERRLVRRDGVVLDVEMVGVPITYDGAPAVQVMARDVTDRKRAERALAHQALHDLLTGLPNRALALDRLAQGLARTARAGGTVAVLFVDLDRFKAVNDDLGHDAADRVLRAVAARLGGVVRPTDTVARFGSDEFVLVCDDVEGPAEATRIANRVVEALALPMGDGDEGLGISASIGIALAGGDDGTPDGLVRNAETAMYRAKELGRSRIELFDEAMRSRLVNRLHEERLLARAVAQGELDLYYQPVVQLPGLQVTGVEALVRWRHPERGLVLPGDFIPLAEESGLILDLGAWVLAEGCRQARRWAGWLGGRRRLEVAVNLSAKQLTEPHFVKHVELLLESNGLKPSDVNLCLEITETLLLEDPMVTASLLTELRDLGVRLSIDDFGTGYSSLSYLRRFPVDHLKIDRSFVSGLGEDHDSRPIAAAIVDMAHALGLEVVAEGVETPEQLEVLVDLGCDAAQGFLFSPAVPAAEIEALLVQPRPAFRWLAPVRRS